jgi:hypothetical protein
MEKNLLPKEFRKMLGELKRLDDELGITLNPLGCTKKETMEHKRREQREHLLKEIWQNCPRKTFLTKDVLQMRGNALKNPEIRAILEKIHIRVEDCALVDFRGEDHIGQKHDCPAHSSPEHIQNSFVKWDWGNIWFPWLDYKWGGPKDPIKILFEQSDNNRYRCVGLIQMFDKDRRKGART